MTAPALRPISAALGPTIITREMDDLIGVLSNRVMRAGSEVTIDIAIWPEQRAVLQARLDELVRTLDARDRRGVALAVTEMMLSFGKSAKEGDTEKLCAKFIEVLDGAPVWAVRRACHQLASGAVPGVSKDFAPTTARVVDTVQQITAPVWAERQRINEILHAVVRREVTPEQRAAIGERMRGLVAEMQHRNAQVAADDKTKAKQKSLEAAQRAIERAYAASGMEPVTTGGMVVSQSLLDSINKRG